jgi:transposase
MSVVRRRVFSQEFKREAVEKAVSSGLTVSAVAIEIDVHETVLRRWIAEFSPSPGPMADGKTDASKRLLPYHDLLVENARLHAENERLRMERETLKKALAIVFAELPSGS